MKKDNKLNVLYKDRHVGTLAISSNKMVAFEYSDEWIENGFSINPFSLPLRKEVFVPTKQHFDGLFGVFADSLPDAWGQILLNRVLRKNNIPAEDVNVLDRLAIVGSSGMGALTYQPEMSIDSEPTTLDLDKLAGECNKILNSEYAEHLDELYKLGGTSGGARPKIMTEIDGEDWIIKFPAHIDSRDAGKMEYDYAKCAEKCGIIIPETKLFPSNECAGYFGIKRFDRIRKNDTIERTHMLTVAALLEIDFEQPSLDYNDLMKLTKIITRNNEADLENMFRRMCFNVFAHNRDDHAKNFTYIYDEATDLWRLSPAYDLTYSNTYYGEHTTSVDGNGRNPGIKELLNVGVSAGLSRAKCTNIITEIEEQVQDLRNYV